MAKLTLGFASSHAAQLKMKPENWSLLLEKDQRDRRMSYEELLARDLPGMEAQITQEKWNERYDACHAALGVLRNTVAEVAPDVIVVIGDDQHEQFSSANMPMFSVFFGAELTTVKRGGARDTGARPRRAWSLGQDDTEPDGAFPAGEGLARHMIRSFVEDGVDVHASDAMREEVGIGHAFNFLYRYILPEGNIPVVPFSVNTFFPPNQPTPRRCYEVGQALGRAIGSWESDARVAVMASGGLSHVILDEEIDDMTLTALAAKDADALANLPVDRLTRGTSEIRNWVVLAGATEPLDMTLIDYIPCYRTMAGTGCGMGFATWQ